MTETVDDNWYQNGWNQSEITFIIDVPNPLGTERLTLFNKFVQRYERQILVHHKAVLW